jgi:hypothetical protein
MTAVGRNPLVHAQIAGRAMDLFNIPAFLPDTGASARLTPKPLRQRPRTHTRQPCARGMRYPLALPSMWGRSCRCLASQTDGRGLVLE